MSDTPQNPGWWLTSDGKWYPPEKHPDRTSETESPPAPREPVRTAWWRRPLPLWLVVVIAVAALGLGAAIGAPPDEEGASPAPSSGATGTASDTEGREAAATSTTRGRQSTTTRPAPTTTTAPSTTTTTAPPRAGFGGGTQLVGTDVAPGIYVAADLDFCYWERLSGLSGSFDEIITNDNATGQAVVEIRPTDAAFNSQRCGRWELYAPPTAPLDSFGDGDWIVGEQIQPGRYPRRGRLVLLLGARLGSEPRLRRDHRERLGERGDRGGGDLAGGSAIQQQRLRHLEARVMDEELPLPAKVVGALGVATAVVLSTWMTIIAFVGGRMPLIGWETDGGIGTGLVWLLVVDPFVITVVYWATMLLVVPLVLIFRPKPPTDENRRGGR